MTSQFVNLDTYANYENKSRLDSLRQKFATSFGKNVEFFCRAPGRVNLIGEHIDYCGYGVLPMAVSQDVMMAVAKNDEKKIRLVNTNEKYESHESPADCIEICQENPKWFHYFMCGFMGVLEKLGKISQSKKVDQSCGDDGSDNEDFIGDIECGMDVLVDGCVPSCAGLSSSSALVCASAMATMMVFQGRKAFTKIELAELCQQCEKYIGTEGGGMDQTIAFLAQQGKAKYVEFNPLKVTDVTMPEGVAFVIANSCVQLNKAATSHFNTRVAECRLAAQILATKMSLDWMKVRRLVDLQNALKLNTKQCQELVKVHLKKDFYWKGEVSVMLGVTELELNDISLSSKILGVTFFKTKQRAKHVFSESERVLKFKSICDKDIKRGGDGEVVDEGKAVEIEDKALVELGELMNESHRSCVEDYECSCEELDEIVEYAKLNGALGCRLTGAGWGGCCVSMVRLKDQEGLIKAFQMYYVRKGLSPEEIKQALFSTQPGSGASIIELDQSAEQPLV